MNSRAVEITSLCDKWLRASRAPDGGVQIPMGAQHLRLLSNNIRFHDLDYDSMRAACVGLTKVLLLPGMNTFIDADHTWFWSWCGELFAGAGSRLGEDGPPSGTEIDELTSTCFAATLAPVTRPPQTIEAAAREMSSNKLPANAKNWVNKSHVALAYLAFPLLEASLKRACSDYVGVDGIIRQEFTVPDGTSTRSYRIGKRISSLRDLLWLLSQEKAGPSLQEDLTEVIEHMEHFGERGEHCFNLIFDWRNSSLHGAMTLQTVGGTVLNIAILVMLDTIRDSYVDRHQRAFAAAQRNASSLHVGHRSPWSFYPPYV